MDITAKMKRDWDRRARHHARFWIATEDYRSEDEFHASGEGTRRELLELLGPHYRRHWTVLEVGCGIGRVLRPLAGDFSTLYGVDVSSEMIAECRRRLADTPNVHTFENSGVDLHRFGDGSIDFAYSFVAFQHMPRQVFRAYLSEVHRVLDSDGLLGFQIMVGSPTAPDFEDTIGLRVYAPSELREILERGGFALETPLGDVPPRPLTSTMILARRAAPRPQATPDGWQRQQCSDRPSPLDEHLCASLAREAVATGPSAEAIRHLRELADQYPQTLDAWTELARLLIETGELAEAEAVLQRAARYHPECGPHLRSLRKVMGSVPQGTGASATHPSSLPTNGELHKRRAVSPETE